MKTIIFDVDGVLADFDYAFTLLGNSLFGTPISCTGIQPEWNFRNCMTSAQQSVVWDYLRKTPEWWCTLQSLVSSEVFHQINLLSLMYEVYFVTSRVHDCSPVGEQTVSWLRNQGIHNPRVVVSSKKGEVASAVEANYAIEDNWANACAIHWMTDKPQCQVFLIEREYNKEARKIIPSNIKIVRTVADFLGVIRRV